MSIMRDCPNCDGTGVAVVGLIGFSGTWRADCPDCEGTGQVHWSNIHSIERRNARRIAQRWPKTPPSGAIQR